MAEEKTFAKGLFIRRPNERTKEKAPWVKLHLGFKVDELVEFLQANKKTDGFVNVDIKVSKDGNKLYGELDTFEPKKKQESNGTADATPADTLTDEVSTNDLPTVDPNEQAQLAADSEKDNF